jgi:hypothetical protein
MENDHQQTNSCPNPEPTGSGHGTDPEPGMSDLWIRLKQILAVAERVVEARKADQDDIRKFDQFLRAFDEQELFVIERMLLNRPDEMMFELQDELDRHRALTERVRHALKRTDLTVTEQKRMYRDVHQIIKLRSQFLRREKTRLEQKHPRRKRGWEDAF